jgi:hypothetical protein
MKKIFSILTVMALTLTATAGMTCEKHRQKSKIKAEAKIEQVEQDKETIQNATNTPSPSSQEAVENPAPQKN